MSKTEKETRKLIKMLLSHFDIKHDFLIEEMILSTLKLGQESEDINDLNLLSTTIDELRNTFKGFAPFRDSQIGRAHV